MKTVDPIQIKVVECTTHGDTYRYVDLSMHRVPLTVRTVDLVIALRRVLKDHGLEVAE